MSPFVDAMRASLDGEQAFARGDYETTASRLREAIALAKLVPPDGFNRAGFLAPVYVRLTQVLGLMQRHQECLTYGEEALSFLGQLNPHFFAAFAVGVLINLGNSMVKLDRLSDALNRFREAEGMIRYAPEMSEHLPMLENNIRVISGMLSQDRDKGRREAPRKRWWQI